MPPNDGVTHFYNSVFAPRKRTLKTKEEREEKTFERATRSEDVVSSLK